MCQVCRQSTSEKIPFFFSLACFVCHASSVPTLEEHPHPAKTSYLFIFSLLKQPCSVLNLFCLARPSVHSATQTRTAIVIEVNFSSSGRLVIPSFTHRHVMQKKKLWPPRRPLEFEPMPLFSVSTHLNVVRATHCALAQ